ncbi:MAG TPA: hypothetical protein H9827_06305 [Candidatus Luteimonas excrementigallinarum]|nr:hypothetical protein [Candidatus Luteimonas excrementigallinarum]
MIPGLERFRGAASGAKALAGTLNRLTEKHRALIPDLVATPLGRHRARAVAEEMRLLGQAARELAKAAEGCHSAFLDNLEGDDE